MSIEVARHLIADGLCVLLFMTTLGLSIRWAVQDHRAGKIDRHKRDLKIGIRLAILILVILWTQQRISTDLKDTGNPVTNK